MKGTRTWTEPHSYYEEVSAYFLQLRHMFSSTHLTSTPLQTHHEKSDTKGAEKTTDVVDLAKNLLGWASSLQTYGILVEEDDQNQADEIPDTDQNTNESPVARSLRDELCPQW